MAERVGFEPTLRFPVNTLSKRAPSATRPPLHHSKTQEGARLFTSKRAHRALVRLQPLSHLSITANSRSQQTQKAHAPLHQDARVACLCLHKDAREAHRCAFSQLQPPLRQAA